MYTPYTNKIQLELTLWLSYASICTIFVHSKVFVSFVAIILNSTFVINIPNQGQLDSPSDLNTKLSIQPNLNPIEVLKLDWSWGGNVSGLIFSQNPFIPTHKVISCLSTHPFKYASWLSAQIFQQKARFVLYCLNMSCKVVFCECMNFVRLTFNVHLLTFR